MAWYLYSSNPREVASGNYFKLIFKQGNKDNKFIEERRTMLERFMKELSKFDYLIKSKEF